LKLLSLILVFILLNGHAQASDSWSVSCDNALLLLPNFEKNGHVHISEFGFTFGFVGINDSVTSAFLQDQSASYIFEKKDLGYGQLNDLEMEKALALGAYMGVQIRHDNIRSGQEFTMKDKDGFQARLIILEGLKPQDKLKMFEYNWGQGLCD